MRDEKEMRQSKGMSAASDGLGCGGFHLLPYDAEEIRSMVLRMRDELGVRGVGAAHCTGHLGFEVFRQVFGD